MIGGWFDLRGRGKARGRDKLNIRFFKYETLRIATNNFSTLLGRGGYGSVFKGVLPDDGRTVAIKIFRKPYDGFLEMVELMSHIRHKNLIQVIGCCLTNNKQQLLVCEFAENGSVWGCLYGVNTPQLDWKTRASLCIGTARGLSYLHHEVGPQIIHRDIKPSNVLLDANFVPKIVDFDLIHVYAEGEKQTAVDTFEFSHLGVEYFETYTTTAVKGTLGYLDPTYILKGQLTEKVDVYSFGLLMLEIITGRKPIDTSQPIRDEQLLLDWVTMLKRDGTVLNIVDPKLTDFPEEDVERFINVALLCTRATSEQRPSMFEVVHMLYGRLKSDMQISEMAATAITDSVHVAGIDYAAETYETVSGYSDSFIVLNRSEGGCSAAALVPLETSLASEEEQICPEDVVKAYYDRSMEKIMRYQVGKRRNIRDRTTVMTQTMVVKKYSGNMFPEAVYPPFLSGEYRSARVLYSGWPSPS